MKDKEPVSITLGFKGWGRGIMLAILVQRQRGGGMSRKLRPRVSGRCGLIACSVPTQNRHGGQLTVLRFSLVLTTWSPQSFP